MVLNLFVVERHRREKDRHNTNVQNTFALYADFHGADMLRIRIDAESVCGYLIHKHGKVTRENLRALDIQVAQMTRLDTPTAGIQSNERTGKEKSVEEILVDRLSESALQGGASAPVWLMMNHFQRLAIEIAYNRMDPSIAYDIHIELFLWWDEVLFSDLLKDVNWSAKRQIDELRSWCEKPNFAPDGFYGSLSDPERPARQRVIQYWKEYRNEWIAAAEASKCELKKDGIRNQTS